MSDIDTWANEGGAIPQEGTPDYPDLKVGDHVVDVVFRKGMTGTVTEVIAANPENPIEEHGSVTVRLDPQHVGNYPCSPPDEEHYVEYEWWKALQVIPKGEQNV